MGKGQIVALSVDKVQNFLTETTHAHVQEKQTEKATLKNIMKASREISVDFFVTIQEAFSDTEICELLSCSGVFVFSCDLPADEIEDRLNRLFLTYYHSSQGQKLLRCVSFPAEECSKIEAIQEAKKQLKQSRCMNERIEKNRDVLFSFCTVDEKNISGVKENTDYPMFAKDINALFPKEMSDNENHFRIAVIKADLDGIGHMLQGIDDYEDYRAVSQILNEEVSLDGLHRSGTNAYRPKDQMGWIFPYYTAGDDIFFAVAATNLTKGIDVCKKILCNINQRLKEVSAELKLTMSIGVEITFNREPIRYYMDMVERQLRNAKETLVPDTLQPFLYAKICICNLTFLDIAYDKFKKLKKNLKCLKDPSSKSICNCNNCKNKRNLNSQLKSVHIWEFFLKEVKRLNYIRSDASGYNKLLATPGFFYTLLERISDEAVQKSDIKYINSVLYCLSPKYSNSSDERLRTLELLLNASILYQLLQKGKNGMQIVLNNETRRNLETYLRLMLLFSDSRFQLINASNFKKNSLYQREDIENARKYLFTKSTDYLYSKILEENRALRRIFIKKISRNKIFCLQRLKIEKSMFVKLRNTGRISVAKAASMIELRNPADKESIQKICHLNVERVREQKKPCYLYFDKENFNKQASRGRAWNPDYVDSLMLFYEYKEMEIRFKSKHMK